MTHRVRGLVAFDLDGTLIKGRTVCELIAEPLGRLPRMRSIERLRSEEHLAAAREEMATWYRAVPEARLLECLDDADLASGATEAVDLLKRSGVECAISSITWLFAVERFGQRLGVSHCQGTSIDDDGQIAHVWPRDKGRWVRDLAASLDVPVARVASVGDSWRDADMFLASERAFFVGDQAELPRLPDHVTFVPDGDLVAIAQSLVREWTSSGTSMREP
ncbi:MAG: haloacid dehalogenase-like hydrolase [Vicinamibacterales bacterium]